MRPIDEVAQPLLEKLAGWQAEQPKLKLAIDGYPGSGKTTLANYLGEKTGLAVIHLDDYLLPLPERLGIIRRSEDPTRAVIFKFHDDQRFLKEISNATAGVVVDGVFTLDPTRYPSLFDRKVYVASDWNLTDARRIKREKARWKKDYKPESDADSLFAIITRTYRRWSAEQSPEQLADVVLQAD